MRKILKEREEERGGREDLNVREGGKAAETSPFFITAAREGEQRR
jgi:hypothetical protein